MHFGLQALTRAGRFRTPRAAFRGLALWMTILTAWLGYLCAGAVGNAAAAEPSLLCAGYEDCAAPPFTTHGYPTHQEVSWWSMYAGDNCTNYTAYVESQVYGVASPGYLLGDAYQWSANAAAHGLAVDTTPSVGAVAAWGSDSPGIGADGHVAVVENVGPDDSYIDVSESGMGSSADGYDWERIYADAASWDPWPTDFIHFPQTSPPVTPPRPGTRVAGAEIEVPGT